MIESDNPLMESAWHLGPSKFNVWCLVIGIVAAGVTETYRYKMSKKETTKYSNAGKGDKSRVTNKNKFDKNWEKIFGKKKKTHKLKMSDFPIPTTKVFKDKRKKSRQQKKIDLKREINE